MTKEGSYQIDCACAMNLCQDFGRAMIEVVRSWEGPLIEVPLYYSNSLPPLMFTDKG